MLTMSVRMLMLGLTRSYGDKDCGGRKEGRGEENDEGEGKRSR